MTPHTNAIDRKNLNNISDVDFFFILLKRQFISEVFYHMIVIMNYIEENSRLGYKNLKETRFLGASFTADPTTGLRLYARRIIKVFEGT